MLPRNTFEDTLKHPWQVNLLRFLVKVDIILFQIITLGRAKKDETISAAAYEGERTGKIMGKLFRPLIDLLFRPFQKDHCRLAWEWQHQIYKD